MRSGALSLRINDKRRQHAIAMYTGPPMLQVLALRHQIYTLTYTGAKVESGLPVLEERA